MAGLGSGRGGAAGGCSFVSQCRSLPALPRFSCLGRCKLRNPFPVLLNSQFSLRGVAGPAGLAAPQGAGMAGGRGRESWGEYALATYRGGESRRHLPDLFGLSIWWEEKKRGSSCHRELAGGKSSYSWKSPGMKRQIQAGLGSRTPCGQGIADSEKPEDELSLALLQPLRVVIPPRQRAETEPMNNPSSGLF